jgi:hypothetical protein
MSYTEPGIYNALDSVYMDGMTLANTGADNQAALQATIQAAVNAGGGIVLIPATDMSYGYQGFYKIAAAGGSGTAAITIPPGDMTEPLVICGTGNGTALLMETNGATLFDVTANPWVTFQDLTITYDHDASDYTGTAFNFNSTAGSGTNAGYRLFRVNTMDCQYPVVFNGNPCIASMLECAIQYSGKYPTNLAVTAISISGTQVTIDQCTMLFPGAAADTAATIGISIGNSVAGTTTGDVTIKNTYIGTFQTGISIGSSVGNVQTLMVSNLNITTPGYGVSVQGTVSDASFVNCVFQGPTNPLVESEGSGILIGAVGSPNDQIDTLRFRSCTATGFSGNGMEIVSGQNIQVTGGIYAGNGSAGGAGIAITGPATEIQLDGVSCIGPSKASTPQQYGIAITAGHDIQITGANCSGTGSSGEAGSYPGIGIYIEGSESATPSDVRIVGAICVGDVLTNPSEQLYGISVSGGATDVCIQWCTLTGSMSGGYGLNIAGAKSVFASNCDLTENTYGMAVTDNCEYIYVDSCNFNGSTTGALYASSPGTLQIINSSGYNDQGAVFTGVPASGSQFDSNFFDYYGPIAFYVTSGPLSPVTQIKIDGTITHLVSGGFTLSAPAPNGSSYAGETAAISYGTGVSPPPPYFLAVGK